MRLLTALLVLTTTASVAACGTAPSTATPRACTLLTDSEIQSATGETPSSVGGGDATGQSTCSWALPGAASGVIGLTTTECTPGACDAAFASAAPTARFTEVPGLGAHARISSAAHADEGIVVQTGHAVFVITAINIDRDIGAALRALARSAASRAA